jgi:serine phosphatase RsbU (regulator of sigma subunit)
MIFSIWKQKKWFLLLFFYFVSIHINAQKPDSLVVQMRTLKETLAKCTNDTCRLNTIFQLHYLQLKGLGELTEKNAEQFDISYAKEGIRLAGELNKYDTLKSLTVDLGYVFDLKKQFDSSFVYYSNCLNTFEYTNNYQLSFSIAQNILYNNSMLQSIIEENNRKAAEQKRKIDFLTYTIIGALFILLGFMGYFFVKMRQNNRLLKKQKEMIEYSKEQIDASINYAQNLQHSIISNEAKLKKYWSNAFLLFLPRDKVSGDFFWLHERDGCLYMAVADCTGHGVPGALLSIVGYLLLDKILSEEAHQSPTEILEKLHTAIVKSLDQENSIHNRDGMDITLLRLNTHSNELQFASAHRPLYLIRNNELIEYKGTRRPVGGVQVKYQKTFDTQIIHLEKGDQIYAFSDGYADQAGGQDGKKLMAGNLKKFLLEISELDMASKHERMKSAFINYKGAYEQTDDVLMLGLKME